MKYDVKELTKVVTILKGLDSVDMSFDPHSRLIFKFNNIMTGETTEITLFQMTNDSSSLNAEIKVTRKL